MRGETESQQLSLESHYGSGKGVISFLALLKHHERIRPPKPDKDGLNSFKLTCPIWLCIIFCLPKGLIIHCKILQLAVFGSRIQPLFLQPHFLNIHHTILKKIIF